MGASLVLAVLLAQAAPSATAPPVIIEVKSRLLCTALRTKVQPTLVGLMTNDQTIDTGRIAFDRMGMDEIQGSNRIGIDRLYVKNTVGAIVHNLEIIDHLLDDPALFPAVAKTDDERTALAIKKALQAIEDRQKIQLNALSGIVATDELSSMQHEFPDFNPTVNHGVPTALGTAAPVNPTDAGLAPSVDTSNTVRATANTGLAGNTLYGKVAVIMHGEELHVGVLENAAATQIMNVAQACRNVPPEPSPSP